MPGEFLAVDVGGVCCAVAVELHAVRCDVFLFFCQEFGVPRGVRKEEGGEYAKDDGNGSFDKENERPEIVRQAPAKFE